MLGRARVWRARHSLLSERHHNAWALLRELNNPFWIRSYHKHSCHPDLQFDFCPILYCWAFAMIATRACSIALRECCFYGFVILYRFQLSHTYTCMKYLFQLSTLCRLTMVAVHRVLLKHDIAWLLDCFACARNLGIECHFFEIADAIASQRLFFEIRCIATICLGRRFR